MPNYSFEDMRSDALLSDSALAYSGRMLAVGLFVALALIVQCTTNSMILILALGIYEILIVGTMALATHAMVMECLTMSMALHPEEQSMLQHAKLPLIVAAPGILSFILGGTFCFFLYITFSTLLG